MITCQGKFGLIYPWIFESEDFGGNLLTKLFLHNNIILYKIVNKSLLECQQKILLHYPKVLFLVGILGIEFISKKNVAKQLSSRGSSN